VRKIVDLAHVDGESVPSAEASLYGRIRAIQRDHDLEDLAIAFYDYETGIQWCYNAERPFHAASTMKLAVLLAVFRQAAGGVFSLDSPVQVRNRFTSIVDGSPFTLEVSREDDSEIYSRIGKTMTVRELVHRMITSSSNLATNLLVDVVTVPVIHETLKELSIEGFRILRGVEDQAAFEAGLNNEVTATALMQLLRSIADRRAYSDEACGQMIEILHGQKHKSGIPAGLPSHARVAHKTGNIRTVHHDAGIVYIDGRRPFVLVVLTEFSPESSRRGAVAEVSRDVYRLVADITP
jgi:beta-lactamase class A